MSRHLAPVPSAVPAGLVLPELAAYSRPRLRDDVPVLWREATSIQLGDDVVLDRVSRGQVAWLTSLDGLRTSAQVEVELPLPVADARRLLRGACAAAALEDAARIPDALRWAQAQDRDAAAQRFGAVLRTYRDLDTAFDAMAARQRSTIAILGSGALADDLADACRDSGLTVVDDRHATVTILADGLHPDVPAHFDHQAQDRPHLAVAVLADRALVGPLVLPGRTGCLRCAHLHHRDADPAWPLLAVQWSQALTGMPCRPVDPVLVRLAALQAVLLVRAWLDRPDQPDQWSGFAVEVRLPDGLAARVARPAHPLCGCRWPAA